MRKKVGREGLSMIEILIIVAIIAILLSIAAFSLIKARNNSYYSRAFSEMKTMNSALELYFDDNHAFPPDVSRDVPPGLGKYLGGYNSSTWPDAPWPGSVYDWDNWDDPDHPGQKIVQISIRFCPVGGPLSACHFPSETWAANFNVDSAVYYCVQGACRSHINQPINYPGYCVNCN
jgi:type II secretory pathway pseudopilin PulG